MSTHPRLTVLCFGSSSIDPDEKTQALLTERFGEVEWLRAGTRTPKGEWIWCIPERSELSLGALLRVEGILEEGGVGIHFFHVVSDLANDKPVLGFGSWKQSVSARLPFLQPASLLLRASTWQTIFTGKNKFADLGLTGLEDEIHAQGLPFEQHPECLHVSDYSLPKLALKRLYSRGRNWLRPWETAGL